VQGLSRNKLDNGVIATIVNKDATKFENYVAFQLSNTGLTLDLGIDLKACGVFVRQKLLQEKYKETLPKVFHVLNRVFK